QTHLVDTDSESEPFEDVRETKELQPLAVRTTPPPSDNTPTSPNPTAVSPLTDEEFEASEPSNTRITLSHSTASSNSTTPLSPDHPLAQTSPSPTRVSYYYGTARMVVRTQPTLSLGMLARIAEATALSSSSFHKRYKSSYETPSPSSFPTLPIRKRYRGTSELIEDTEDESSDLDTEREGPGSEDEGLGSEDGGLGLEDEGPGSEEEDEEAVPEGQQQAVSVVDTAADEPLGLGYRVLRRCELALGEGLVPSTFEIRQSSRFMSEQQRVEEAPAPWQPVCATWVDLVDGTVYTDIPIDVPLVRVLVQTPPSPESREVRDEIFFQRYRLRSLEQEQERAKVTFSAIWRLVLALESWAGHVDAQRAEMWRVRYDDHRLIPELLVQNTTMQRELQEIRDRVTILEREGSRRGQ
ncbi:hypothetical protein Tco_1071592, partial [Tanacetum coccineum]